MKITISLLREVFQVHENNPHDHDKKLSLKSPSSRLKLTIAHGKDLEEVFIIRTKNMYASLRMASKIIHDFEKKGPLTSRTTPISWTYYWEQSKSSFDYKFNPELWVAIYNKGKLLFSDNHVYPFLDVIEKCDVLHENYADSVNFAQDIFAKAGKEVTIKYESTMALISTFEPKEAHSGMILRGPFKTKNFNYYIDPREKKDTLNIPQLTLTAAAFLECVELSMMIGTNSAKLLGGELDRLSIEAKKTREGRQRLAILNAEIDVFEKKFKVRYRPERPNFIELITEIQNKTKVTLPKPKSEKDPSDNEDEQNISITEDLDAENPIESLADSKKSNDH